MAKRLSHQGHSREMNVARRNSKRRRVPNQALRLKVKDEIKQVDIVSANYPFSTTATFTLLNGVALGSDNFNRIGRKFFMKSIQVRGSIRVAAAGPLVGDEYCRMIVFYDRQTNFAAPTYANLMQMTTSAGATSSTSESLPNEANKNRFLIIKDFTFDYPGSVLGSAEFDPGQNVNWFLPLKNDVAHYLGTSAAVTDISSGSLYICFISRNAAPASPLLQFTGTFRLRYSES